MLIRTLAAVLGAASLAMLVHSVANPLYDDQVNAGAIWDTLSWIMAVGFPLALARDIPAQDRGHSLRGQLRQRDFCPLLRSM